MWASSMPSYENRCILKRSETDVAQKSICMMDVIQCNIHDETLKCLQYQPIFTYKST